jgi:exopolysaccharide biosynthesis WecB/TagA/CpsF family protein
MPSMNWFDADWATYTASTQAGAEVRLLASIVEKQAHLEEWISAGCPTGALITYANLFGYPLMRPAPDLYGSFDYVALDGIALAVILRYLFPDLVIRRRSPDLTSLVPLLFDQRAGANSRSVYLVGGTPADARTASEHLSLAFPNARFIGARAGYFGSEQEWAAFAEELSELQPDITLVGMGTPLQDLVAVDLRRRGVLGTIMTCGGFLSQTAQKTAYYPKFVDRFNLRWAYRAIREPHVRRRLYRDYPRGAAQVIRDYQSGRLAVPLEPS